MLRLQEEQRHLEVQQQLQAITCPVQGKVINSRLTDMIGQYLERGAVICIVEDQNRLGGMCQ